LPALGAPTQAMVTGRLRRSSRRPTSNSRSVNGEASRRRRSAWGEQERDRRRTRGGREGVEHRDFNGIRGLRPDGRGDLVEPGHPERSQRVRDPTNDQRAAVGHQLGMGRVDPGHDSVVDSGDPPVDERRRAAGGVLRHRGEHRVERGFRIRGEIDDGHAAPTGRRRSPGTNASPRARRIPAHDPASSAAVR